MNMEVNLIQNEEGREWLWIEGDVSDWTMGFSGNSHALCLGPNATALVRNAVLRDESSRLKKLIGREIDAQQEAAISERQNSE